MSERTVADDTLTPGASTTCWDPTGWAEPMYSATTALRMAALRASSSPLSAVIFVCRLVSVVVGIGVTGAGTDPASATAAGVGTPWCWHSTLVSADPLRTGTTKAPGRLPHTGLSPISADRRRQGRAHAEATNIRWVMAGPRAMVVSPTTRVKVPSGARAWMSAVVPGVSPWSPR